MDGWKLAYCSSTYSCCSYDPFGNPEYSDTYNLDFGSWGYKGSNQIITEDNFMQTPMLMGARVYLPSIGRFTSTDPIPGGNVNAYAYPLDPINGSDITGMDSCFLQCTYNPQGNAVGATYLQPQAPATYVQSTIGGNQIQYNYVNTIAARREPTIRAPHYTGTPIGPLPTISGVPIAPASNPSASLAGVNSTTMAPSGGGFNLVGGGKSAMHYYNFGKFVGGAAGCIAGGALTAETGGWGCFIGGPVMGIAAGAGFAAWGFVEGGLDLSGAGNFDYPSWEYAPMPWQY